MNFFVFLEACLRVRGFICHCIFWLVKYLYSPFCLFLVMVSEMVEVVVKEVDSQGRVSIPVSWRARWKSRKFVMIRREDRIELVPFEFISPSELFDSIKISDSVDFADPHSVRKALVEQC